MVDKGYNVTIDCRHQRRRREALGRLGRGVLA